jgi:hypothetical protein
VRDRDRKCTCAAFTLTSSSCLKTPSLLLSQTLLLHSSVLCADACLLFPTSSAVWTICQSIHSTVRTHSLLRYQSTQHSQIASPLLRLPPELRNKIYAYACRDATSVSYMTTTKRASLHNRTPLLLTCRQISVEVASLLQAYKVVHLVTLSALSDFVDLVGSEKCAELEEIKMVETMLWTMVFDSRWDPSQTRHLFRRMQRMQVTCPGHHIPPGERSFSFSKSSLRDLFGKSDLEVEWVAFDWQ